MVEIFCQHGLGSLFTNEYEVRGYSYSRFLDLNKKGRLLILLDGFDEMKHAMSWTDFRNEIEELNKLNAGNSRVILLGRPSAFTSDDEHVEVLRGRRKSNLGLLKLQDWPEFREFDLEPFTVVERSEFVGRYLRKAAEPESNCDGVSKTAQRITEVNAIADTEPDIFGKPVHAKILVELALNPEVDLSSLAANVTRWGLYTEFFESLARRESTKNARAPIDAQDRLRFIRTVAVWLWQNRDGATSFKAADLPNELINALPDGEAQTPDEKRREYLTGSFLERKSGDAYFFAHRSFAEFLVAQHMALQPPTPELHSIYDPLVRDGVLEFLEEAKTEAQLPKWGETLSNAKGTLSFEYLSFLVKHTGLEAPLKNLLTDHSPWRSIVALSDLPITGDSSFASSVASQLRNGTPHSNAIVLYSIGVLGLYNGSIIDEKGNSMSPIVTITIAVAAALIERVLDFVREASPMARLTIEGQDAALHLQLAQAAIPTIDFLRGDRTIMFSWPNVAVHSETLLQRSGLGIRYRTQTEILDRPVDNSRIPFVRLLEHMKQRNAVFFSELARRDKPLSAISVVSHALPKRRG